MSIANAIHTPIPLPVPPPGEQTNEFRDARIMIVDDEPAITAMLMIQLKKNGYRSIEIENDSTRALAHIRSVTPDLVILDIGMPDIDGLEILRILRESDGLSAVPVLIMTASNDECIRREAFELQANDFLTKPTNASELAIRVRNSLLIKFQRDQLMGVSDRLRQEVAVRTRELLAARREAILCLARTAESRDTETGKHVLRVGRYSAIIASELGLDEDFVASLELAAQLHDVGKIAIPDSILYKPGNLSDEEFSVMKTHCQEAERIFGGGDQDTDEACTSPLLQMAARIALTHHERWDGQGYPQGLTADEIPMEGRITAVADVFDALSSRRHYKEAFPIQKCFDLMRKGKGSHFDPSALEAFFRAHKKILQAMEELQDPDVLEDNGDGQPASI